MVAVLLKLKRTHPQSQRAAIAFIRLALLKLRRLEVEEDRLVLFRKFQSPE